MKVAFRADASTHLGSGHVMRCLVLARKLRENNVEVALISRALDETLLALVQESGIEFRQLDLGGRPEDSGWAADADATCRALPETVDWLIVDHYALDARWHRAVRAKAKRIMVIDDLADRPLDADLLLDQNLVAEMETRYAPWTPPTCKRLLGPRYALLHDAYKVKRARQSPRTGSIKRILVSFGAGDATNETSKALKALQSMERPDIAIDVVVGSSNPHRDEVADLIAKTPGAGLYLQLPHLADRMAEADLFLGAVGTTTWERCCLSLPGLVTSVAANQEAGASALSVAGCHLYLGPSAQITVADWANAISTALRCPSWLLSMARASEALVDGLGASRVVHALLDTPVVLRPARADDCRNIFDWRNAAETRRHVFNPEPLSWEEHENWFRKSLRNQMRLLLIGEVAGAPIGVLRYDLEAPLGVVSIYLVPGSSGRGLGTRLLEAGTKWLRARHPEVTRIKAEIMPENLPSRRAFISAGYYEHHLVYERELH